jgi:AcrR family transcriptional regulator
MVTDMNNTPKSSPYNSPLRARQKEQTGTIILEAVARILSTHSLAAVTIAEVARVAEITERTVYRHFATRDDLLHAFWTWQLQRAGGQNVVAPASREQLLENIQRLFSNLDQNEGVVRAMLTAPDGAEIRRTTNEARVTAMNVFLERTFPGLPADERRQLAAGITALASIHGWVFMRDNCGYDGREAGLAAAFTIDMVLEAASARAIKQTGG